MNRKLVNLGNSFDRLKMLITSTKFKFHVERDAAYRIKMENDLPHLMVLCIVNDDVQEYEVDLVNKFTAEELDFMYMDMQYLFDADPRIEEIFAKAMREYRERLNTNQD